MAYEHLLEEAQRVLPFRKDNQRSCTFSSSASLYLLMLGAGIIIGLIPTIINDFRPKSTIENISPIPSKVLLPTMPKVFAPDSRFMGTTREATHNWEALIRYRDTVFIPMPDSYNLERGFTAPLPHPQERVSESSANSTRDNFYRISNSHQLYCVNMVRIRYLELLTGRNSSGYDFEPPEWDIYISNCFEYLRQSITCGDTLILEGESPAGTPHELRVGPRESRLGWGTRRECIDWEGLVSWQGEMEKVYNETWH
jgi:hypothetical protein